MKIAIGLFVVVFHLALLALYKPVPLLLSPPATKIATRTFVEEKVAPKKVAKIAKKRDKIRPSKPIDIPKPIGPLEVDLPDEKRAASLFVSFLRRSLQLPEEGAVKVRLSILASGKVENVEIVTTESEKNSAYLVEEIKKLTLPNVGGKKQTVVIAFCNDS